MRENAKRRVVGLEAAVAAMIAKGIEESSPEVATLKECLSKAKRSAEEPPVSAQLKGAQEFVEREQKCLDQHDAQRRVLEKELAEGEARVQRLQVLAEAPQQVPPPPAEWGAQVTRLQQMVNQLQAERDALAEQVKHRGHGVGGTSAPHAEFNRSGGACHRSSFETKGCGRRDPKWPAGSRFLDVFKAVGVERRGGNGRDRDCERAGAAHEQRRSQDGIFPFQRFPTW